LHILTPIRSGTVAIVLFGILLLTKHAIGHDRCGSFDRVMVAIQLTRILYPELKGEEFSVSFGEGTGGPLSNPTDARSLSITLDKPRWRAPQTTSDNSLASEANAKTTDHGLDLPVYLTFDFVESATKEPRYNLSCRPQKFRNTRNSGLEAVQNLLNTHPEWSDADALRTAKNHGLRFGPEFKAAILRRIPWRELSVLYGSLRTKKAVFEVSGNAEKCIGCSFTSLHWYIEAEEVGTRRSLGIFVEPFHGRVDGITEYTQ
jgi:hypothetical protein